MWRRPYDSWGKWVFFVQSNMGRLYLGFSSIVQDRLSPGFQDGLSRIPRWAQVGVCGATGWRAAEAQAGAGSDKT